MFCIISGEILSLEGRGLGEGEFPLPLTPSRKGRENYGVPHNLLYNPPKSPFRKGGTKEGFDASSTSEENYKEFCG
jgi:hypothetical protein